MSTGSAGVSRAIGDWVIGFLTDDMHCHTAILGWMAYQGQNVRSDAVQIMTVWAGTLLAQRLLRWAHVAWRSRRPKRRRRAARRSLPPVSP